jgi:hypothetical protein
MVVGVTGDHVRSLFGVPVMQNKSPGVTGAVDYFYMTNHAWIVTREMDGVVLQWSITVTDAKFKIDLQDLTFGLVRGKLGHTTFAESIEGYDGQYEEQGAAAYTYAECRYFGRPSAYQTFVFTYNRDGVGTCAPSGQSVVASPPFVSNAPIGDLTQLEEPRQGNTINTFYACGLSDGSLVGGSGMWPVVHGDFVAPLRGSRAERKKWLKKRLLSLKVSHRQRDRTKRLSNKRRRDSIRHP